MAPLFRSALATLLVLGNLPRAVLGEQILQTQGFASCLANGDISVQKSDVKYDNDKKVVTFDLAGTSMKSQKIQVELQVTAYGIVVYKNTFNPCDTSTSVPQLCPLPAGSFAAQGSQLIPEEYYKQIPSVAFSVPDIAAEATIKLKSLETGNDVACVTSHVGNGKTVDTPVISYIAAGIAAVALAISALSALSAAAGGGGGNSGGSSPGFIEMMNWFQGIAINGMLSVNYPVIYRNFTKNFAFSTGIIGWTALQTQLDNFRGKTGANLTNNNVQYLKKATLVFTNSPNSVASMSKRSFAEMSEIMARQITTSTGPAGNSTSEESTREFVYGIGAFVEQLQVPKSNTFLTMIVIVAIVIAAIVVGILLFKLILELWALFGSFPKSLTGFRKHYWGTMTRTIINLILMFCGIWVLYCIYQLIHGDSWAARLIAGITLGVFTAVLLFFSFKVWRVARKVKKAEGDVSELYNNKKLWLKYSILYDGYKKDSWWLFGPVIIYAFAKGVVVAAGDGYGFAQAIAQLVVEVVFLGILLWKRPFEYRTRNVVNIGIQVVRALMVGCILVFVQELGISQTTQSVMGLVLIIVQSCLTALLVILMLVNAIIICCKKNPHRQRRLEMEKLRATFPHGDHDPHHSAQDSLLNAPVKSQITTETSFIPDPRLSHQNFGHVRYPSDGARSHDYERPSETYTGEERDSSRHQQPALDRSYLQGPDQFEGQRRTLL